jgi:hypothetical protein
VYADVVAESEKQAIELANELLDERVCVTISVKPILDLNDIERGARLLHALWQDEKSNLKDNMAIMRNFYSAIGKQFTDEEWEILYTRLEKEANMAD